MWAEEMGSQWVAAWVVGLATNWELGKGRSLDLMSVADLARMWVRRFGSK